MMAIEKRPDFIRMFLDDLSDDYERRRLWALVPTSVIISAGIGFAVAFHFSRVFFLPYDRAIAATVLVGLLAFNALTLALSWNAFGRIYELLTKPGFSQFIKESGELSRYMFHISYYQIAQVLAACASLFGLAWVFLPETTILVERLILGVVFSSTLYALFKALGAVTVAQDLVWNFSQFDSLDEDAKRNLRLAVNND